MFFYVEKACDIGLIGLMVQLVKMGITGRTFNWIDLFRLRWDRQYLIGIMQPLRSAQ